MSMRRVPLLFLAMSLCAGAVLAQGVTLPAAERSVLANGTVLILIEDHEVPLVSFEAVLAGGAIADPDGREGVATLLAELLGKGAGERDAAAFAEAVDAVGGRFDSRAELEAIHLAGEFLAGDSELMIGLLADALLRPRLDTAELDKLATRRINVIRAAKDGDPGALLPSYANAFVYGTHSYGRPAGGDETSLAAITHDDVTDYYSSQLGGDRLVLAVAGDFESSAMRERLTAAFSGWRPAGLAAPLVAQPQRPAPGRVLLVDKPGATQSYFWIGNLGVARAYPERAALDLANTLFGGRFTSMLNTALRIESGLTYGAQSQLVRPKQTGTVAMRSFTQTDSTVEAIDMALGQLARLRDGLGDGDTAPEMLDSARNYVLGQFPTSLETAAQLAGTYAMLESYGLEPSYVNDYGTALAGVTAKDLEPVIAAVYPASDDLMFVVIGDATRLREAVAKYGTVTEMPITAPRFDAGDER